MKLQGHWYEPQNSTRHVASLILAGGQYNVTVNSDISRQGPIADFTVSDRLGKTDRRLQWSDGAVFETSQNDELDGWLELNAHSGSRSLFLHKLEKSWRWALVAVAATAFVTFSVIRWGLPAASVVIAEKLPVSVYETVSVQSLKTLDRILFSESEADADRQAQVQQQFDLLLAQLPDSEFDFRLYFRQMNGKPNALALPGGQVVVTDAFLELAEHEDELNSVLLHEIGHVSLRHGMTHVIQASALSVILTLALGDMSALGDLAVGLPIFIMQSSYSRQRETEADNFAFEKMSQMGKDPKHFATIITRLTETEFDPEDPETSERSSYFSTHPHSAQRAQNALEASKTHQGSDHAK